MYTHTHTHTSPWKSHSSTPVPEKLGQKEPLSLTTLCSETHSPPAHDFSVAFESRRGSISLFPSVWRATLFPALQGLDFVFRESLSLLSEAMRKAWPSRCPFSQTPCIAHSASVGHTRTSQGGSRQRGSILPHYHLARTMPTRRLIQLSLLYHLNGKQRFFSPKSSSPFFPHWQIILISGMNSFFKKLSGENTKGNSYILASQYTCPDPWTASLVLTQLHVTCKFQPMCTEALCQVLGKKNQIPSLCLEETHCKVVGTCFVCLVIIILL